MTSRSPKILCRISSSDSFFKERELPSGSCSTSGSGSSGGIISGGQSLLGIGRTLSGGSDGYKEVRRDREVSEASTSTTDTTSSVSSATTTAANLMISPITIEHRNKKKKEPVKTSNSDEAVLSLNLHHHHHHFESLTTTHDLNDTSLPSEAIKTSINNSTTNSNTITSTRTTTQVLTVTLEPMILLLESDCQYLCCCAC
jgi:hypothetical protein